MSERKSGDDGAAYEVGYGRPPKQTQFRPGKSGNPRGRPKGVQNLATDVMRTLSVPIKVKEAGRTKRRSTQEGALMVLRDKALRGDPSALKYIFELALRFNCAANDTPTHVLSADDRAILAAYLAEAAAIPPPENNPTDIKAKQQNHTAPKKRGKSERACRSWCPAKE